MIPARFHALRNRVLAVTDHVFAEPVRLHPMKKGVVDPDRPAVEIEAILRVGGGKETLVSGLRTDKAWRSKIQAQRAELHIDRAKFPNLICRREDKVRGLARDGQPWFEVLGVDERGETRLILQLGEA